MAAKGERLVVRLDAEDKAFIAEEAEKLGLDMATAVRALIRQRRLSKRPLLEMATAPAYGRGPSMVAVEAMGAQTDARLSLADLAPVMEAIAEEEADATEPVETGEPAADVDIDALVTAQLAEAEAKGLTQARPEPEAQALAEGGVKVIGRRRPPPYSIGTQPSWLQQN